MGSLATPLVFQLRDTHYPESYEKLQRVGLLKRQRRRSIPKVETPGYFADTRRLVLRPKYQRPFDFGREIETVADRELPG
jgi:hypothetical protein